MEKKIELPRRDMSPKIRELLDILSAGQLPLQEVPIERVFRQIEELLERLNKRKENISPSEEGEIKQFDEGIDTDKLCAMLDELKRSVEMTVLPNDKTRQARLEDLPKETRVRIEKLLSKGEQLKRKVLIKQAELTEEEEKALPSSPQPSSHPSPLQLPSKGTQKEEDTSSLEASLENKRRFSRLGARKHWKPT